MSTMAHDHHATGVRVTRSARWIARHDIDARCTRAVGTLTDGRDLEIVLSTDTASPTGTHSRAGSAWWDGKVLLHTDREHPAVVVLPFDTITDQLVAEAARRFLHGAVAA